MQTVTVTEEVMYSTVYRSDYPAYEPDLPRDTPEHVVAVAQKVIDGVDESTCECDSGIGFYIDEDPDTGHPTGGYTSFWVVFTADRAWAICEDCLTVIEGPSQ